MKNQSTVAVIGAGAIGAFYGAKLYQHGLSVEFYSKKFAQESTKPNKSIVCDIYVNSIWGSFSAPITCYQDTKDMQSADFVLLTTKALPSINYFDLINPVLKKTSTIICIQNGLCNEENLEKLFPNHPIVGVTAFTCIHRSGHTINHIDYGLLKLAPLCSKYSFHANMIYNIFQQAGIESSLHNHLKQLRWEKLLWNIPFNALSVILHGANTHDMLLSHPINELVKQIMYEIFTVAKVDNVDLKQNNIEDMIQRTQSMKPYKTSMLLDFEKKSILEIEAIIGQPRAIAHKHNIPVPQLDTIYSILYYISESNIAHN